jgi:GR25 family glycosyltransferase involved in LPS biosynthesis
MNFYIFLFFIFILSSIITFFTPNSSFKGGSLSSSSPSIPKQLKIYVINLDRRKDRLENVNKQLKDLEYTRISAIDGKTISNSNKYKYISQKGLNETDFGLKLTNGAIGLGITFYNILNEHKSDDDFIIFEDDITLKYFDYNKLQKYLQDIDYDIIYLGHHKLSNKKSLTKISDNLYKSNGQVNGTFGLLISGKNKQKILNEMYPLNWQIDTALYMSPNLNRYILFPPMVTSPPSHENSSDIQYD